MADGYTAIERYINDRAASLFDEGGLNDTDGDTESVGQHSNQKHN